MSRNTIKQWNSLGRRICKGSKARTFDPNKNPLFDYEQTYSPSYLKFYDIDHYGEYGHESEILNDFDFQ